jgi:ABC-2 type transport system ATP-binding protein
MLGDVRRPLRIAVQIPDRVRRRPVGGLDLLQAMLECRDHLLAREGPGEAPRGQEGLPSAGARSDGGQAPAVVTVRGLRKSFTARGAAPVEAVRGVDMDVEAGEVVGFLGPNGAGKTTTLRMLATLLPIDAGSATVAGYDVARQSDQVRRRIGYVSQLGGSYELATGRPNLVLQGRLYGGETQEVRRRVAELIELPELVEFADRRVNTYSGGQRRRLDGALGIIHEPRLLFLDEPSTGLDPQNRANLWDHIAALRDRGTTVFLTTHYLEEADAMCDRLMIIDRGRIVAEGTPQALKRQVSGDMVLMSLHDHSAPARAVELLRAQPFIRELGADEDRIRLYVDDGGAALPELLRLLDREGIGLRSLSLSEPTLDDVFLRQTGRSLRDSGRLPVATEVQA